MIRERLEADCRAVGEALKRRSIPKEQRREARSALNAGFRVLSAEPASTDDELMAACVELAALLGKEPPEKPVWIPATVVWAEARFPVAIRAALRVEPLGVRIGGYARTCDRLEKMVDWFWERCDPKEEKAHDKTVAEMAMEEFGEIDMQYVWGKKRRPPPPTRE